GSESRPNFWRRIAGAGPGEVERGTRIAVAKEQTDVAGIAEWDPSWMETESETIQSKAVLGKVIEDLNLSKALAGKNGLGGSPQTDETYDLLKQKVKVGTDPKTGLIDIKVKSDNAQEAAKIANTIAEVYRDYRLKGRQQMAQRGVEALEKAFSEQNQKIAQVEQELEERRKVINAT